MTIQKFETEPEVIQWILENRRPEINLEAALNELRYALSPNKKLLDALKKIIEKNKIK
jgi:hypothetical protein